LRGKKKEEIDEIDTITSAENEVEEGKTMIWNLSHWQSFSDVTVFPVLLLAFGYSAIRIAPSHYSEIQ
jgi:hypothetical protein